MSLMGNHFHASLITKLETHIEKSLKSNRGLAKKDGADGDPKVRSVSNLKFFIANKLVFGMASKILGSEN